MNQPTGRRLSAAGPILVLVVSLVGGYLAARQTVADVYAYQAAQFVKHWYRAGQVSSDQAWDVAYNAATAALDWAPVEHASHYDRLGRIHEWRGQGLYFGHPDAVAPRHQALDAYQHAVALRPLWPYTWVRIADIKLQQLAFDEGFGQAMSEAVTLGPWRYRVNQRIAEIGFTAWWELTPEQRAITLAAAERLLEQRPGDGRAMYRYAQERGLATAFCAALDPRLAAQRKLCQG